MAGGPRRRQQGASAAGLASLAGMWPEQPALTRLHQSRPVRTALRSWQHPQEEPDWNKLGLGHSVLERDPGEQEKR